VVIDDNSQDGTPALAEAAGAAVYTRSLDNFAAQRNFALTKVTADWVLFIDADERMTPQLMEGVREFVGQSPPAVGAIKRVNHAFGRRHRFGQLSPDFAKRLFPNGSVNWVGLVHESPESVLPVRRVRGFMRHYTYDDWPKYMDKLVKYAKLWAESEYSKGRRTTMLSAITHAALSFGKTFIMKLGFLEGPLGWVLCWYNGCYTLTKYAFLSQKCEDEKRLGSRQES
jgi:glycosyltransferase involved in cell wall biosynthesis